MGIASLHGLKQNQRIEKASTPSSGRYCSGFFQTSYCFFGNMAHPGRLVAIKASQCALLRPDAYNQLRNDCTPTSAAALKVLSLYMTRKRLTMAALPGFDGSLRLIL